MDKTLTALKLAEEALEELHYSSGTVKAVTLYKSALAAIREALSEPVNTRSCSEYSEVKQEPVAFKFPREPKPENAMGWTIDYGLIRQIAEDIGDQEFYPGYEGIELTLMALEHIYTAQVPDRLAAAAHDLLEALRCVVNDWVAPDGLPFEDGEMPALDSARAAIAKATGSQS